MVGVMLLVLSDDDELLPDELELLIICQMVATERCAIWEQICGPTLRLVVRASTLIDVWWSVVVANRVEGRILSVGNGR